MQVIINSKPGYHVVEETVIKVLDSNSNIDIIISVTSKGKVTVFGSGTVNIEIPYKETNDGFSLDRTSKDVMKINTAIDGMENGLDVSVFSEKHFNRSAWMILAKEKDSPVIKVRNGSGDWREQYIMTKCIKEDLVH